MSFLGFVALVALLIGYWLGRRSGLAQGINQGQAEAALWLRQKSLETGFCQLCDNSVKELPTQVANTNAWQ